VSGEYDTDVLVVGSGPAGATCALALATYGVRVRVATKWNWLANGPRAHITNQRALEVLRDLGVEAEATSVATPWNLMGDTMFTTSLAGQEVARLRTWGTGENRIGDYLQGSPCPLLDIPQPYMEPVLVKNGRLWRHLDAARPAERPRVHRPQQVPGRRRRRPIRDRR
jgi:2,4-dichlorophenol 6-monooxygenase